MAIYQHNGMDGVERPIMCCSCHQQLDGHGLFLCPACFRLVLCCLFVVGNILAGVWVWLR